LGALPYTRAPLQARMLPSATHGLELKARWCGLLLSGHKTVELRSYALPNDCIGELMGDDCSG